MNIRKNKHLFLVFLFLFSENVIAGSIVSGEYESLNAKYQHNFSASGDYSGTLIYQEKITTGAGLYEQGSGICWRINSDGSKGATGNVMLYVDQAQCCLEIRQISDKYAVTKVWRDGTGFAFRVCQNQVLRSVKE